MVSKKYRYRIDVHFFMSDENANITGRVEPTKQMNQKELDSFCKGQMLELVKQWNEDPIVFFGGVAVSGEHLRSFIIDTHKIIPLKNE